MQIQIDKLQLPLWIIDKELLKAEKVSKHLYLQTTSNLSIKNRTLENMYLIDEKLDLFIIKKVIDVGNFNPFWVFEFFNPLKKIIIEGYYINDEEIKGKVKLLIEQQKGKLLEDTLEV